MVLLSTQNTCSEGCLRKCLHFNTQFFYLQKGQSKKGQREKSPSPEKLTVLLHARACRVGTFRGALIEPIQLSEVGIDFYMEGRSEKSSGVCRGYKTIIRVYYFMYQGSYRLEKYLNIQDCLVKSMKIKFALKST